MSVPPVKELVTPASKSLGETPPSVKTPGKSTILKPTVSQTEPRPGSTSRYLYRAVFISRLECRSLEFLSYTDICLSFTCFLSRLAQCKTPGCFLQSLSNTGSSCGRNFKQIKEAHTSRLYQLFNTSVFDNKVIKNRVSPTFLSNSLELSLDLEYFTLCNCFTNM